MSKPIKNYANLGHKVTTRQISWEQLVREAEGSRWNLPQATYFFGNNEQIVYVQYDMRVTGPGK